MATFLNGEQLLNANRRSKSERGLPAIGLKEFEPSNSWLQNRQIESALNERIILLKEERVEKSGSLSTAVWKPTIKKAEVVKKTGKVWDVFGHHSNNSDWLYPEEALFLMEMNCLELLFEDVPMSIQKGYSVLIDSENGCTLPEYRVYLHLSRQGYRVLRHDSEVTVTAYEKQIRLDQYVLDQKRHFKDKTSIGNDTTQLMDQNDDCAAEVIDVCGDKIDDFSRPIKDNSIIHKSDLPNNNQSLNNNNQNIVEVIEESSLPNIIDLSNNNDNNVESSSSDSEVIICEDENKKCDIILIDESDDEVEVVFVSESKFKNESDDYEEGDDDVEEEEEDANEEEDVEEEEEDDSESVSSSEDWKRKTRFENGGTKSSHKPHGKFNYAIIDKFLLDSRHSKILSNSLTVDQELKMFYDEIEIIDLESESRHNLIVSKSRNQILDDFNLIKDGQGLICIPRPDERVLPLGVKPKYPFYRINVDSIKSETQKKTYENNRPYRGHYNNNFRNRNSSWNFNSNNYRGSTVNQISQLQTMARGMMEMASAVLLNTMVPQQQPFWSTHQSNFASILSQQPTVSNFSEMQSNVCSIMPVMNYSMTPPPPVIQDRHSNHFQYQSPNIRSPLVSNSRPEEQFRFNDSPMPFIKYHRNNYNPRNTFSQIRTYNPNNRESNENRFSQLQRYRPYRSNYRPNFVRNEMNTFFESNNVITESNERETNCDPAYRCRDIPVSENFIPLRKSQIKSGENEVQTVSDKEVENDDDDDDDNDDDDDDDVIIIEEPATFVEKRAGRQKRRFPGENNFMTLKNKSAKKKKRNKKHKSSEVAIIDIDDGPVMTAQGKNVIKTEPINTLTLMNENRISTEDIKVENGIQEIKLEKDSLTVPLPKNNINGDQNDTPVFVKKESQILNPTIIKNENENLKVPKVENDFIKRKEQEVTPNLENVSIKLESDSIEKINCNEQVKVELDNCLIETTGNHLNSKICPGDKIDGIENEKLKGNDDVLIKSIPREDIESQIPVEVEVVNHLLDEVENSLINNEIVVEKISSWSDLKKAVNEVQRVGMELTVKRDIHIEEKNENTLDDQPLLKPHHCQTVDSILTKLQIFSSTTHKPLMDDKLKIMYDMYLPTATFRKTSPGLPAYRIVVMGSSSPVPSPGQILDLKSRFKDDIPVLIAIVMSDSVSYFFLTPISLPVQC